MRTSTQGLLQSQEAALVNSDLAALKRLAHARTKYWYKIQLAGPDDQH